MLSKKLFALLFISAFVIVGFANAHAGHSHDDDEDEEDSHGSEDHVIVLTKDNFETEVINGNVPILVEFYAPWCGHCKSLAPEYAKAAAILKGENVKLGKVDATEEGPLAEKYGVKGYPTLKFFRNGSPSEYNGGRTASEIVSWLKKKTGPPAVSLGSLKAVEDIKDKNEVVIVGVFAGAGAEKDLFLARAASDDDAVYALVEDASVAAEIKAKVPSVVVFKKFDELRNDFSGPFDTASLNAFVDASVTPLVMEFNDENVKKIFGSKIDNKALFFVDNDAALVAEYKKVAEKYKGKAVFATVGKDKEQVMDYFGLKAADLPTFFMLQMSNGGDMKKFKHAPGVAGLDAFVDDYLTGKVKPFLKSAPVPEADPNVFVKTLVGTTFAGITSDPSKAVLVEFYAPWCGHCKSLAPKYEKLAKKLSGVSDIVVAAIDSTANDVEGVDISGFPTIKLWPKGENKKPIDYDGARTVKGLTKFLKEHSGVEFEVPKAAEGAKDDAKEDL